MLDRLFKFIRAVAGKAQKGRSSRWPALRKRFLEKNSHCCACGGTDHLEVHHCLPVSWPDGAAHELDEANLMTLCESPGRSCHLWIGHLGDWKSYNPQAREDAATWLAKIRTRPYQKHKAEVQ